ncbi:MAG: glycosyltransferase family 4 protein [Chloroflexi bacterium]|nr:glycosyltransferase family 4 protein [Chloroflexota bacterium]
MRPALYYPWVYLRGGAERTLLELMTRSRYEWTLYTNRYEPDHTFPEFAELPVRVMNEVSVRRSVVDVARAGITLLTQTIDFEEHDSLMVMSEGLGNLVALRSLRPTSCICLTPLKIVYDEVSRAHYFRGGRKLSHRVASQLYARIERPAWQRYVRVFCNSTETLRRVRAAGLVDPGRLEVAYHGVDMERFRPDGRREPFFLVAGRIMWTKNVELAIRAWRRFKPHASANSFRLVIAGMVDHKSRPYVSLLRAMAAGRGDIEFVETPSDDELTDLYARCHAVLFPSLNEDFGLVPLEAMASGKPVLAVDRGGPRETVVDGHTGLLLPDSVEAFAHAMRTLALLSDAELDTMGARARARASQFSWDRFVDRIDEHVDEIVWRPRVRA